VQLLILDLDNKVDNATRNAAKNEYRVVIAHNGSTVFTGYALNTVDRSNYLDKFNRFTLFCTDGLTTLKDIDNDYSGFQQLGDFFVNLLGDVGFNLNVNIVMDREHQGASAPGGILPNVIRIDVDEYTHIDKEQPSKYDLLIRLLDEFNLQIFQEENEWWIMQRGIRDSSSLTKYTWSSSSWSSSSFDPTHTINSEDLRKEETNRRSWRPLSRVERVFAIQETVFNLLNEGFDNFTAAVPDHWEVTAGAVDELSSAVSLDDKTSVLEQSTDRILRGGDQLSLSYDLTYFVISNPPETWSVGLIQIIAERLNDGTLYYNSGGSWTTTPVFVGDFQANQSNPSSSYDVNSSVTSSALPGTNNVGYKVTIKLIVNDPSSILTAFNPVIYRSVDLQPEGDLQNQYVEQIFSATNNDFKRGVESIAQKTGAGDVGNLNVSNTYEFFDGTKWASTRDWGSDSDNQPLAEVVLIDLIEQRLDYRDGFFLRLPRDYQLYLHET